MIGLAAIGGFLYLHKQRGGELTLESFKRTARELFGRLKTEATELKDRAEKQMTHEVASTVANATGQREH
jgi:hypothetical protein